MSNLTLQATSDIIQGTQHHPPQQTQSTTSNQSQSQQLQLTIQSGVSQQYKLEKNGMFRSH